MLNISDCNADKKISECRHHSCRNLRLPSLINEMESEKKYVIRVIKGYRADKQI